MLMILIDHLIYAMCKNVELSRYKTMSRYM